MINNKTNYFEDKLINNGVIVKANEGENLSIGKMSLSLKVTSSMTNDQLGIYEIKLAPNTIGAKPHYHRFMDETFIINKGKLTMQVGENEKEVTEGSFVYVPRFTAHGFANNSNEEVVLTLIFNPSQKREGFFYGLYDTLNENPIDPEKYLKLYNKYDSYPIDTTNMLPISK